MLTHPLVLGGFIKMFVIAGAIMWSLVSFVLAMQGDYSLILQMGLITSAVACALLIVGMLAMLIFYRNRTHMRFTLNDEAAISEVLDRRINRLNRMTVVIGALAGRTSAVGVGLLADSRTKARVDWPSVVRVRAYPRWHAIRLGNAWRTTMIVFCSPATYDATLTLAMRKRAVAASNTHRSPLWRLLARTILVVLACTPLFNLPIPINPLAPIFTLCFALASIWLVPLLSWAVLLGLVWISISVFVATFVPFHSVVFQRDMARYEVFSADDTVMICLAAAGAAFLIWLSIALLRGRIVSVLMGDLVEMGDGGK